ncbi:MAG: hypothetical protein QM762_10150 [Chryseolinea sp.]
MPSSNVPTFLQRLPVLLVCCGIIGAGALTLFSVRPPIWSLTWNSAALLSFGGFMCLLAALMMKAGRLWSLMRLASVNAIVFGLLFAFLEAGGRLAKVDFSAYERASAESKRKAYPPWTQEPDLPLPEVYFQHSGPLSWTGQPLRALEVLRQGTDNAYLNEPSITVSYDSAGFRNPENMADWDVVVVGDSYTELGYLPDAEMSSSVAGMRSGFRVKNLGVCDTGLLTYARYLQRFGAAPSCKQVVFVMFEGNDIQDTTAEYEALQRFQLSGEREYRQLGPQTSFAKSLIKVVRDARNKPRAQSYQNAWFTAARPELPVTISVELPIGPKEMTGTQLIALKAGVAACAKEAKALGLAATLVYVPVNNRVYNGLLRFGDSLPAEVPVWQPHDLPRLVAELCAERGMAFVDTTPALRAAAEKGRYVHNRILDCHVNTEGAKLIGDVIGDALGSTVRPAQVAQP